MRSSTLQLSFPFGLTGALALVMLMILIGVAEGVARLPWMKSHVPAAVGSRNQYFDIKIGELDYLLAEKGKIDCIFLGSSVVWRGIDPAIFEQQYHQQTGDDITCYNFGIPGAKASSIVLQTDILLERYQPRLLIYGFTLRALAFDPEHGNLQKMILDTPWVDYQRNGDNLEGWLVDRSQAYRRYLAVRDWADADFESPVGDLSDASRRGFVPTYYQSDTFVIPRYFSEFQWFPFEWRSMQQVIALSPETDLLLVEVPLPDEVIEGFLDGPENYRAIWQDVVEVATESGVPVWTTTDLHLIPSEGWTGGPLHMNGHGAIVYSTWLGDQVGAAVRAGDLPDPTRTQEARNAD